MNTHMKHLLFIFTLSITLPASSVFADETVYGWQLMSEQERLEHNAKMQSMKTQEERSQYRLEHHEMMEQRAKEQGVTLPDVPQNRNDMMDGRGGMMGNGMGNGGGRGMGGGMGSGGGMGGGGMGGGRR